MANSVRFTASLDDKVSSPLAKIRDQFDRLGKNKGAKAVMQGIGMGAGISAWGMLSRGISGAIDMVTDSIAKASDLREAMALTEQVFEDNAAAVDRWSDSTTDAFSKREALDFASKFGTAFKNVGMALDETTAKAQEMTTLAGDLGSAFNTSSEEAAVALRSGLLGESEPLRRFGVFLDEAKVKAKAAAMGMEILGGKLTDAQKVTARYALILEQTADSQGMFGRDTGSLADAQKMLTNNMEDLQAEIGEALLPIMVKFTKFLSDEVVPALRDVTDWVKENEVVFEALGTSIDILFSGPLKAAMNSVEDDMAAAQEEAAKLALAGFGPVITYATLAGAELAGAGSAAAHAVGPTKALAGRLGNVAKAAKDAAQNAEDLADAMDEIAEAAYGPEQLVLQLEIAKDELGEDLRAAEKLRAKIERFKELGKPVGELEDDYRDLRLEISEGREEVFRLTTRTMALDGLSMDEIRQQFNALGNRAGYAADEIRRAYLAARKLAGIGLGGINPSPRGGNFALAGGGFAPVGSSGTVGEAGMERMVVTPMGAFVTPMGGGGGTSGPVTIQVVLPGVGVIAEAVDRHFAYKAGRAPKSPYSS